MARVFDAAGFCVMAAFAALILYPFALIPAAFLAIVPALSPAVPYVAGALAIAGAARLVRDVWTGAL